MVLLNVPGSLEKSLVVVPEKYANIGRYFNGINNFARRKKKFNVRIIRCQVPGQDGVGESRVLLYTCCRVEKDEELVFDYNLGAERG